jgi:hypothetical protein
MIYAYRRCSHVRDHGRRWAVETHAEALELLRRITGAVPAHVRRRTVARQSKLDRREQDGRDIAGSACADRDAGARLELLESNAGQPVLLAA